MIFHGFQQYHFWLCKFISFITSIRGHVEIAGFSIILERYKRKTKIKAIQIMSNIFRTFIYFLCLIFLIKFKIRSDILENLHLNNPWSDWWTFLKILNLNVSSNRKFWQDGVVLTWVINGAIFFFFTFIYVYKWIKKIIYPIIKIANLLWCGKYKCYFFLIRNIWTDADELHWNIYGLYFFLS